MSGVFIGTAGWNIPARYARDFPTAGSHLDRYAARLAAVEINSSFYRPHRRSTYARWAGVAPEHFRFSVKLPKAITHERRLAECDALLDSFADEVGGLGDTLGVLLVQLPPSLAFDAGVARTFLAKLRAHLPKPVACEPRHASWFTPEAEACLTEAHVSRVAADPPPAPGAEEPGGWHELVYLRLHGAPRIYYSDYAPTALATVQTRIVDAHAAGATAWCIFDNTAAFHALGNALDLGKAIQSQPNTSIR